MQPGRPGDRRQGGRRGARHPGSGAAPGSPAHRRLVHPARAGRGVHGRAGGGPRGDHRRNRGHQRPDGLALRRSLGWRSRDPRGPGDEGDAVSRRTPGRPGRTTRTGARRLRRGRPQGGARAAGRPPVAPRDPALGPPRDRSRGPGRARRADRKSRAGQESWRDSRRWQRRARRERRSSPTGLRGERTGVSWRRCGSARRAAPCSITCA